MTRTAWIIAAIAAALTVFTWVVETRVSRYDATGPELLVNGALTDGLDGWETRTQGSGTVTHEEAAAVLRTTPCDAEKCAGIVLQSMGPPPEGLVVASIAVEVDDPVDGDRTQAFVSLLSRDAEGRFRWVLPNKILAPVERVPWTRYEGAVRPAPDAVDLVLFAMIHGNSGTMRVREASVRTGALRPGYAILHRAGQLGWIALAGVSVAVVLVGQPRKRWRVPFLGTLAIVLWMLLITPGQASEALSGAASYASDTSTDTSEVSAPSKRTWIRAGLRLAWDGTSQEVLHLGMFAVLAFFARRSFEGPRWRLFLQLVAVAAISEVLQQYSDRDTSLEDVTWDAFGVVIGLLAATAPSRGPQTEA